MTTYLGITAKALALIAAAFVTFVAAASITLHTSGYGAPSIIERCAATNGAALTEDECATYLDEGAAVADACGAIEEQYAYEVCEAVTLADVRRDQSDEGSY